MLLAIGDFLRFLVTALFFMVLFIIGLVGGTFVADMVFSPPASNFTNVTYTTASGAGRQAYMNIPPSGGPLPGIIMIPDRWGLNDQTMRLTNVLGDAGFVVITPDIYHGPTSHVIHRALLLSRLTSQDRALEDIDGAYAYLQQNDAVINDRIGVIGFGFGGGLALQYAARNSALLAAVDLYGPVPNDLGNFNGAVMGLFGSLDRLVRPNQAYRLIEIADAAGLEHRIDILDPAGNGFLQYPNVILQGTVARDGWNYMVEFLHDTLDPKPPCRFPELFYPGIWCP